jgi:hypothetical protein
MNANLRTGDDVTMIGTVEFCLPGDEHVRVNLGPGHVVYTTRNLVKLANPSIEVGDTVRLKKGAISNNHVGPPSPIEDVDGVVLAIAHDHAWVEIEAGIFGTWWLENVERIRIAGQETEGGDE